jgi:hypothetical protein
MLKNTVSIICKPLQLIFNYSLQTRKFPKIWKSAIVIALPSCRHSSMSLTSSEVICRVSILLPVRSWKSGVRTLEFSKNTASTICKPLQLIFNYSLQTRKFPKIWKSAIAIALFKKGIKSDPSNYRPISLLSCVGKVFESVVFKYLFNFLLDNSLIYKYQSGHTVTYQIATYCFPKL